MSVYMDMSAGRFHDERYSHQVMPSPHGYNSGFHVLKAIDAGDFKQTQDNWKFHLSISPEDTPAAWDIVTNRLMETNYPQVAKVAKPDTAERFADPNSIQAGKQITIYTDKRVSPERYKNLIKQIEQDLIDYGIRPGPQTNADRCVPGSNYASYRAEKGRNGEYVASSDLLDLPKEERFNPFNAQDPYADFTIVSDSAELAVNNKNMSGVSRGAFGKAIDIAMIGCEKLKGIVRGHPLTIRDVDWKPEKINGQNVAMVETTDLSGRQLSSLKKELGDNGIDFNTASSSDGSRSSIAVSDPNSLNRLKNYVQTGNPETTLAQSSRTINYSGLGM